MNKECFCKSKDLLPYIYITKDNVEEFVNKYGINSSHKFIYSDSQVRVEYFNRYGCPSMTWCIKLNSFMVRDDGWDWTNYTEKEFNERFELAE